MALEEAGETRMVDCDPKGPGQPLKMLSRGREWQGCDLEQSLEQIIGRGSLSGQGACRWLFQTSRDEGRMIKSRTGACGTPKRTSLGSKNGALM